LATDGTDGPVTNCASVQAICDGSSGRNPRLSEMAAGYLLPTPVVTDAMGARNSTAWRSNPDHNISIGDTLTDVMWKMAAERGEMELPTGPTRGGDLLPTPGASDCTGGGQHPDRREGHSRQLIDYVLLSTPQARDWKNESGSNYQTLPRDLKEKQWGRYLPAIRRWEQLTRPAPPPTEPNKNGNPRLAAAFSEWLMGWPQGWVTDPDIGISRNDQLKIVGNGVCPQQAAAALRYLLAVATDNTHTHTGGV
jgi:DNA (cytosine-5)-methyltransferase 1